jgi:uncharacterized protein (TIGR02246 family)
VDTDSPVIFDAGDASAIRSLFDQMHDAWSRGDALAYAACFSLASDYVTFNGMHLHGRKENAEVHAALFRRVLKNTKLSAAIESLTFLSGDVALVHTVGSGAKRGLPDSQRRRSIQTFVLVKQEGQWLIRSFQNTRIQPFSIWLTGKMAQI